MKKLIIANWKMNPATVQQAERLAREIDGKISRGVEVVIAPPFPFLPSLSRVVKKAKLGAQDVFWKDSGAYTGEVSSSQLKSLGVKYVIVGHSERRALGETENQVNKKVIAVLTAGLKVILCVGESPMIRKRGLAAAERFVCNQLLKNLHGIKTYNLKSKTIVIAYEPVWAIGAGKSDTPEDALVMIKFIKDFLNSKFPGRAGKIHNLKILYGGSVDAKNAEGFLKHDEIGGALVGGASLKQLEFGKIVRIASKF